MSPLVWLEALALFALIVFVSPYLGAFMAKVMQGENTFLTKFLRPIEVFLVRFSGASGHPMDGKAYLKALIFFHCAGLLLLMAVLMLQGMLPLNHGNFPGVSFSLAFQIAASFVTNTNWQSYSGETTLSSFSQMVGLTVQNFVSAAVGISVAAALARGMMKSREQKLGSFWTDLIRAVVFILLPLSLLLAVLLVSQGVIQSFSAPIQVTGLEGHEQLLPLGPVASQMAIKQLGSNGGGFFTANAAHPFENPTPLSAFLQLWSMVLIPAAVPFMFGRMVGSVRQGAALFASMLLLFALFLWISYAAQSGPNPLFPGGVVWEGIEQRFGPYLSTLWTNVTTATSSGSTSAEIGSLAPLVGLVALVQMALGEVIFGGVGSGFYGLFLFAMVTVFIAGLMVGRTPEYLGKKIEAEDLKLTAFGILIPNALVLISTAIVISTSVGVKAMTQRGPHGLTELLYAMTSAAANNGSSFAGYNTAHPLFYGLMGSIMLLGRVAVIAPVLFIAGHMNTKKHTPVSVGTFPTDKPLFIMLLAAVVLVVGGLTFFPVLTLGPLLEHLLLAQGISLP